MMNSRFVTILLIVVFMLISCANFKIKTTPEQDIGIRIIARELGRSIAKSNPETKDDIIEVTKIIIDLTNSVDKKELDTQIKSWISLISDIIELDEIMKKNLEDLLSLIEFEVGDSLDKESIEKIKMVATAFLEGLNSQKGD